MTFLHGLRPARPRGSALVRRVTVAPFWIGSHAGHTNRHFRRFVKATGYVYRGREGARPKGLSRRAAAHAEAGLTRVRPAPRHPVELARLAPVVAVRIRRQLAPPIRARAGRASALDDHPVVADRATPMPRPTRPGPARTCRPRPNGRTPRAAAWSGGRVRLG